MAEIAVGGPLATDLFALGGSYQPQGSGNDSQATPIHAQGADGDVVASDTYGGITPGTATYKYTDTAPMWDSASTAARSLPRPGELKGGYLITSVAVAKSVDWPVVTVEGHKHGANTHDTDGAIYSPSRTITGGRGVGTGFFANTDTSGASAPTSQTYTLACEHVEADDGQGEHIAGADLNGMETVQAEYVGTPALTLTGFYVTSVNGADTNTAFDTTTIAAEKPVTRD